MNRRDDQCASVDNQLAWLDALGFEDSECFFRSFRFAVFGAWKPISSGENNVKTDAS